MKNNILLVLAVWLLVAPPAANAELVESTTGVLLTFRHCISGETVCDTFGPMEVGIFGGLPGDPEATANHADPIYGEASGDAQLTSAPGTAKLSAAAASLPTVRTGSNSVLLQRYTNKGVTAETLTFSATLTYDQTIPAENASFPADSRARSGANAEVYISWIDAESIEAGTTTEENWSALFEELDPSIQSTELASASTPPFTNVTESGTETISGEVTVEPGDSIWLWSIVQSLAANGAEVNATLETTLESKMTE
jgi:hypothetical protein